MKTKKELKEEYKQRKIPMGIFQIKNIRNNKVLIDNSIDMESKWNRHKRNLNLETIGIETSKKIGMSMEKKISFLTFYQN